MTTVLTGPGGTEVRRPSSAVRRLLVDSPVSAGARARRQRWELFESLFPDIGDMHVLDLGGTAESWLRAPVRPRSVTVLNLFEPGTSEEPWLRPLAGDACAARQALAGHAEAGFDLVFSNSLLEHVGGHAKRLDLAAEIHALAPYHWVQTPYRFFPLEPHWLFPLMQFLPVRARALVGHRWPLAHTRPDSADDALSEVLWTELVSRTEMKAYFPGSRIVPEKLWGLTKSMIAVAAPR